MQKITSIQHACKILRKDPKKLPKFSDVPVADRKAFRSLYILTLIVRAHNKLNKWKIEPLNPNQWKYCAWMKFIENKKNKSGFGLSCGDYVGTYSHTHVGSRLTVGNSESAQYIAQDFVSKYEDWMLE